MDEINERLEAARLAAKEKAEVLAMPGTLQPKDRPKYKHKRNPAIHFEGISSYFESEYDLMLIESEINDIVDVVDNNTDLRGLK
jgi:hypothetical protein